MILTIAIGKVEYADAAKTLAASASVSGVPCSVITDGIVDSGFDHIIHTDESNPYKLKTQIHKLTPYDRTLYIDADSLIIPNSGIKGALEKLKGSIFAAHNYGKFSPGSPGSGKYHWASVADIFAVAGLRNPISALQSSIMYFERSAAPIFDAAADAYGSIPCRLTRDGHFPDELAFSIATSKTLIYPQKLFRVGFCGNLVNIGDAQKCKVITKAGNDGRPLISKFYKDLADSMMRKMSAARASQV